PFFWSVGSMRSVNGFAPAPKLSSRTTTISAVTTSVLASNLPVVDLHRAGRRRHAPNLFHQRRSSGVNGGQKVHWEAVRIRGVLQNARMSRPSRQVHARSAALLHPEVIGSRPRVPIPRGRRDRNGPGFGSGPCDRQVDPCVAPPWP